MNSIIKYVRESYEELKKTKWPTKDDIIRLTKSVIVISIAMGLFVTLFDFIFEELLAILLNN